MPSWQEIIGPEKEKDYFRHTLTYIQQERMAGKTIYPPAQDVFNAFRYTSFDDVNAVIIGQDPYHGAGQAHGLCFSVRPPVVQPPSLENIFKALKNDFADFQIPTHGDLTAWAKQGVLLLNTVLTVEAGKANSHAHLGWCQFTDCVIRKISNHKESVIFLLWGSHAQKKQLLIDNHKHYILKAPHPSPLSAHRGFFDCKHFSRCNEILAQTGRTPINWQLPE